MKRLLTLALLGVASASFAGTFYYQGDLTANSPTYTNPGGGTGPHAYSVFQFTVDTTGLYTFEMASTNHNATGLSDALDTFEALYANSFNPAAPAGSIASSDDFTGTFTVLPGPYAGQVGTAGTGFTGTTPASRNANVNLTAGTQYFLVNTSFRSWNYVNTGNEGLGVGHFYQGISGVGNINAGVPEPASMAALGVGALALLRRRRSKKA